ncbi:MAG: Uma2 family endonuclease [Sphingobacteriaceae bacterium]|nr:Uma2 family endonuclease [Cytophagaceae bacterium]
MTAVPKRKYTPEEYLELELKAPYKSEYFDGEIFPMGDFEGDTPEAMAGARSRHNAIKENLSFHIGFHVRKKGGCRSFSSDQRLHIPVNGLYTYPDFLVVCGKIEFMAGEMETLTNPIFVAEILSKRTASYDRGEKFEFYRGIPTLREYLTLDSRRVSVELWRKTETDLWTLVYETKQVDERIHLESFALDLTLSDLYAYTDDLPSAVF